MGDSGEDGREVKNNKNVKGTQTRNDVSSTRVEWGDMSIDTIGEETLDNMEVVASESENNRTTLPMVILSLLKFRCDAVNVTVSVLLPETIKAMLENRRFKSNGVVSATESGDFLPGIKF